jgi:hypothetical protein
VRVWTGFGTSSELDSSDLDNGQLISINVECLNRPSNCELFKHVSASWSQSVGTLISTKYFRFAIFTKGLLLLINAVFRNSDERA